MIQLHYPGHGLCLCDLNIIPVFQANQRVTVKRRHLAAAVRRRDLDPDPASGTENDRSRCQRVRADRRQDHELSVRLCEAICPYLENRLGRMRDKGMVKVENLSLTASYLLFGAAPVIENDGFSSREKVACIRRIYEKVLNP